MSDSTDHAIRFGRIAAMLPVKNIERAGEFCTKVLGFTKVFENGNPVGFMILKRDQAELHLTLQPDHEAAPFNVAHMMVDDVDALHAICERHGLRIIKSLQDKDYGLRACARRSRRQPYRRRPTDLTWRSPDESLCTSHRSCTNL
jgi:catechol 2,3-dioxygenase-like lactoylglutathione lyase family enzyme